MKTFPIMNWMMCGKAVCSSGTDDCRVSDFVGDYVFVPRGKTCLSVIGQNTMPVYMLHRILRDILMFAGIYDYLGDWGWFALFVLICLSICVIYLLVNPKVVNQVNKILTLYTPRLWGRIRRNQAI